MVKACLAGCRTDQAGRTGSYIAHTRVSMTAVTLVTPHWIIPQRPTPGELQINSHGHYLAYSPHSSPTWNKKHPHIFTLHRNTSLPLHRSPQAHALYEQAPVSPEQSSWHPGWRPRSKPGPKPAIERPTEEGLAPPSPHKFVESKPRKAVQMRTNEHRLALSLNVASRLHHGHSSSCI